MRMIRLTHAIKGKPFAIEASLIAMVDVFTPPKHNEKAIKLYKEARSTITVHLQSRQEDYRTGEPYIMATRTIYVREDIEEILKELK